MRLLYILLAYLLAPLYAGVMLWRSIGDPAQREHFGERFGLGPALSGPPCIWLHAVSIGEVQAAAALIAALQRSFPRVPLLLTTVTPTGAQRGRALFGTSVDVRYVPYDLPGCVKRFFARVQPRVAIILETEIWPTLYHECGRRGVPLVLASARISPRSVGRYRLLARLFRETLSHGIVIAAQSEGDAERFRSIGANPAKTHVTGNIKSDFTLPADIAVRGAALRAAYAVGRPVWIAGSTHEGEETIVLDAHQQALRAIPDALLVLVPRHRNRFDDVAALLQERGVPFLRRSLDAVGRSDAQVLLLDTLGELMAFYAAADVAFVGGSLVPVGGHNLLEPAALGIPVLTGPHVFNAEDIARVLDEEGATVRVHDADSMAVAVRMMLQDPLERARVGALALRAVERNRGALARLLQLLQPVVEGQQPG
jgi:3-deoxy-D-manno-octulosonic-acid transferase